MSARDLSRYMEECLALVHEEIREIVPRGPRSGGLYELMLDYPLRGGKGLGPALCVATCRALGGTIEGVLRSAAALELYHNAFLVHDDVEDGSEKRRNEPTLHRLHGVPIAVNVGDGMLALAMQPLLENVELLGLGRTLRILQTVARMARESVEGQMLELDWIRRGDWTPSDRGYFRMVYKKSAYYSFMTPTTIGAIAAGATRGEIAGLRRFAAPLGIAFQIQDDVLNLMGEEARYGKEIGGDLWEGKHTLVLIHALRCAAPAERARGLEILRKRRPLLDEEARESQVRTRRDVRFLKHLIDAYRSIEYARRRSREWALRASRAFGRVSSSWPESVHREFLAELVEFVVDRDH
jgi:geranylgeranyl diphosphate synthase type II